MGQKTKQKSPLAKGTNGAVLSASSSTPNSIKSKKASARALKTTKTKKKRPLKLTEEKQIKNIKVRITDNTRAQNNATVPQKSVVAQSQMQLALLSPFRFPLVNDRLVGSVARYAGVFFVLIGGFFSLVNLEYATGTYSGMLGSQKAQTLTSLSSGTSSSVNPLTYTNPVVTAYITDSEPLSGNVNIDINVMDAREVKVQMFRNGVSLDTRNATKVSGSVADWKYPWDTTKYTDGVYSFKVHVKNEFTGTLYTYDNGDTYELLNNPTTVTSSSGGSTATTPTSVDSATSSGIYTTSTSVELEILEKSPVSGNVALVVLVQKATEVKVYARNTSTGQLTYAGLARHESGNEWRLTWDSASVPDGKYELQAIAKIDSKSFKSTFQNIEVKNTDEIIIVVDMPGDSSTDTTTTSSPTELQPTIEMTISQSSPISGVVDVFIDTSPVERVEVYLQNKYSLSRTFIGLAQKISNVQWKYTWLTTNTPDGEYSMYVIAQTLYGPYEGKRQAVRVLNEAVSTISEEEEKTIDEMKSVADNLIVLTDELPEEEPVATEVPQPKIIYTEPVGTFIQRIDIEDSLEVEVEPLLQSFRAELDSKLVDLARAIREGEDEKIAKIKSEMEELKNNVLLSLPPSIEKREIIDSINMYLSQVIFELQEFTQKNETILKERIGEAILVDTDKDGISDYDEINLYQTSAFSADTDSDGYLDSTEITLGYNPHDSRSESLIVYESPRETGIIRDDLLVIDSIFTINDAIEGEGATPKALISGKGLPNSFVTLYIFSTPIVVTVKTDSEGSWNYIFDKELDNGEHEVYVGITDNAGRVVAKSNPLPFVKTAEAFTGQIASGAGTSETEVTPSLWGENGMLLVASIAIVALGLVLILLGFHVRDKRLVEGNFAHA